MSLTPKIWEIAFLNQFSKANLKPGQPISVHVDFAKTIYGKLGLFKAVPITLTAIILSFSILGHEKFIKVICIVCSFYLVKCDLSNCVVLLFRSIFYVTWPQLVMFLHVNMN